MSAGLRFLKKERLQKSSDFRRIYSEGQSFKAKESMIWIYPNTLEYNRLGISAPKRKFRLSSTRNRVRRYIKEAYRINKHKLKKGFDIVLAPGHSKQRCSYQELEKDMLKMYKKAGMLE